jgi:tRNA(Ile)-lysidine synthase
MLAALQNHLNKQIPFFKGRKLLLAVSGGIDSMVLVDLLQKLDYDIYIAHCNFNLRGEESDGDEQFIRNYAAENNIKLFVTRFDTTLFAEDNKLSIQLAARRLRYAWFEELIAENQLDYLLTAHHLDDSLETFLINLTRGTGIEGLTGIPQLNQNIVRPLLIFSRDEIVAYAKENEIAWREDSSNSSTKYLRNKLRHEVAPVLKSLNPAFMDSFKETLNHLQQAQSLAEDAAVLVYQQVVAEKQGQKHINIQQLKRLPNYRAYLYQWLSPFGFTAWDDIYALTETQAGKFILSGNYRLLKDREVLILEEIKKEEPTIYYIESTDSKLVYPISIELLKTNEVFNNSTKNEVFVNNELINFPLSIRKWKESDYFYPLGMKGQKKKVSKYFKDKKMSLSDKENTWLLCSGDDIVWIVGRRADERFKVTKETTQILKIELLQK